MDQLDEDILDLLKHHARMPLSEIGKRIHLTVPAVSERMKKLEAQGVIEKYTVQLNREKTGESLLAFIFVNISGSARIDSFRATVCQFDAVRSCHHLVGEYDYLLRVVCKDTRALEYFISIQLKKIDGVQKTNTIIALSTIKETW
ncbi:MAG: Lrp/AsnC family transcriptional regulator [Sporolactobacillus sp.]